MAFPDGYERKCELVIQASQVDADLTDFPVLLTEASLPSEMFDADGSYPAKDGGGDIRFSLDADGQTQLPCEIEEFSTNNDPSLGKAAIWVKIPSVSSSSNTSFYVWYHNPTCDPEQPPADDPYGSENVWDANFKGVWHLNLDPSGAAPQEKDSTANQNDGTSGGAMTSDDLVQGQVGKALSFDGVDDYVEVPDSDSLDITDAITIEAWIKPQNIAGGTEWHHVVDKGDSYGLSIYNTKEIRFLLAGTTGTDWWNTGIYASEDVWQHIVATYDGSQRKIYVNGVEKASISDSGSIDSLTNVLAIGADSPNPPGSWKFNGTIDEVRIYNRALLAEEIATHYHNQNGPASFISPGSPQEGQPITPVALDWSAFDPVLDLLRKTVSLCLISLFGHGLHVFYTDRSLFQEVENILHSRVKNLPTEDQPLGLELLDFYRRFYTR